MVAVGWMRYGNLTGKLIIITVSLSVLLQVNAVSSMIVNYTAWERVMKIKPGVKVHGISPELMLGLSVCKEVYHRFGYEFVVTSLTEGDHSRHSLHYAGQAADLRTRHMAESSKEKVVYEIRKRLTEDYDVVLELTHIHIEYQPEG